jgi:hypothetical protein
MSKTSKKGRPTKYKPEYCQALIDYFDKPLYTKVIQQKMSASGVVKDIEVSVATDMPTFEGFAVDICKVCHDTILEWCKVHRDFSEAYKRAKEYQKRFVFSHTMNGNYNASFAKFFAINCLGMKEQSHVTNEHHVKDYGLAFDLSKNPEEVESGDS